MNQTQSNLGWTTRQVKGKSGRIRVSPLYIFFFLVCFICMFIFLACMYSAFSSCLHFFVTAFFHNDPPPPLFREIFIIAVENFERFSMKKKLKSSVMRLRWLPSHSLQIKANQISPEKQNNG